MDGDKISKVNFKPTAVITDVGTTTNDVQSVDIVSKDNQPVPQGKYQVTSRPATLKVNPRNLTVTAISGSLTTTGGEIVASKLESPDHEYKYGYKAENLASGHKLSGNFVQGKGTSGFQTWIDLNNLQVLDDSNNDVTDNYKIYTVDGYITININNQSQPQNKVYITISAKSGTFVYDGNSAPPPSFWKPFSSATRSTRLPLKPPRPSPMSVPRPMRSSRPLSSHPPVPPLTAASTASLMFPANSQ